MKLVVAILLLTISMMFSGCGALTGIFGSSPIGNSKKVVTSTDEKGNSVVTETEQPPDALSPEIAGMVKACYESFGKQEGIDDKTLAKMESEDIKDVLIFKEFRAGLRDASGFDPRQVCATPKTIYDYAIAHDKQLYETIRHGLSVTADTAKSLGPWGVAYGIAKNGIKNAAGNTNVNGETVNMTDSVNRTEVHNTGSGTQSYQGTGEPTVVEVEPLVVPE